MQFLIKIPKAFLQKWKSLLKFINQENWKHKTYTQMGVAVLLKKTWHLLVEVGTGKVAASELSSGQRGNLKWDKAVLGDLGGCGFSHIQGAEGGGKCLDECAVGFLYSYVTGLSWVQFSALPGIPLEHLSLTPSSTDFQQVPEGRFTASSAAVTPQWLLCHSAGHDLSPFQKKSGTQP